VTSTQRASRQFVARVAVPVVAAALALAVGAVLIAVLGANPAKGLAALGRGAFGGKTEISRTVLRAVPMMLVASGICIAFRASVINIGGEGQMVMGALLSAAVALAVGDELPRVVAIPVVLVAGLVGGGLMGSIPGMLKAYYNVNEILSTIMLNIVAIQIMNALLRGPMIDPAQDGVLNNIPQTRRLPHSTDLPIIIPGTNINLGLLVAIAGAFVAFFLLWRTTLGFRLRAVGFSRDAAKYSGMPVARNVTLALSLSGAFCGLAGAVLVFGSDSHRFFTDGSASGFTGAAGFNGIIAALFGGLHPLFALPASVLFGALVVGANQLQRDTQVPAALITALNGLIVIAVVSSERIRRILLRRGVAGGSEPSTPAPAADPVGTATVEVTS
jgi:general nucleoside transport system permease protein